MYFGFLKLVQLYTSKVATLQCNLNPLSHGCGVHSTPCACKISGLYLYMCPNSMHTEAGSRHIMEKPHQQLEEYISRAVVMMLSKFYVLHHHDVPLSKVTTIQC